MGNKLIPKEPRYLVIEKYPNSNLDIGDIIVDSASHCKNFPKIYRELSWYEYKPLEDFPTYVRKVSEGGYYLMGDIVKITHWTAEVRPGKPPVIKGHIGASHQHLASEFIPATDDEIFQYKHKGSVINIKDFKSA